MKRNLQSKILDQIREYSDTTKRIFKATGIISFDNGFVELAYRELCACIFEEEIIKNRIAGSISEELHSYYDCYAEYEEGINSFYCDVTSLSQIHFFTPFLLRLMYTSCKILLRFAFYVQK